MIQCNYCNESFPNAIQFCTHINFHKRVGVNSDGPTNCSICHEPLSNISSLDRHVRKFHLADSSNAIQFSLPANAVQTSPMEEYSDNDAMDVEEETIHEEGNSNNFEEVAAELQMQCHELLLSMSSIPSVTHKIVDEVGARFCTIVKTVVDAFQMFDGQLFKVTDHDAFERLSRTITDAPFSCNTRYKRMKLLKSNENYVAPQLFTVDLRLDPRADDNNYWLSASFYTFNFVPIRQTIEVFLAKDYVTNVLVFPSNFANVRYLTHPMSGEKAQALHTRIGDYIGLDIYSDEFNCTNPLRPKTSIYKMFASYLKVINLPSELNTQLRNIFLNFIAHSADVKNDYQLPFR